MRAEFRKTLRRFIQPLLKRWVVAPPAAPRDRSYLKTRLRTSTPGEDTASRRNRSCTSFQSWRREALVHCLLGIAGCALVARLIHIQVVSHDRFSARALRQQVSQEPLLARPGDLLDRQGRLLATTITVPSLYVCPARIKDIPKVSWKLAVALNLDEADLRNRLEQNARKQFLWVKRRLSTENVAAVMALGLSERIMGFRREFQRHYPQGQLAAHVLGIRNIDGEGQGGIEESFSNVLRGKDGVRRFVRDARGYVLSVLDEVTESPVDGTSVMLTLDVLIQMHVEQQLDLLMQKHRALGACAIVMNPRNGEVLAMASRPTFDPNRPDRAAANAWKNMATSSVFEPGSTFKPMVVAWGLDRGIIEQDATYDCEQGAYRMGRRVLHDHHQYGELSLSDILVKSSNIGMAKIGEQLGNDQLFELATAFGFGRRTGIELPGELPGLLRPLASWTSYSTGSIPMGQELAATPLQMISAHAVLANSGTRVTPHLVLRTQDGSPLRRQIIVSPILGKEAANWVVQGPMVGVVERGTGKQSQISNTHVFGKTGTAQKLSEDGKGYSSTRHLSSFIGGLSAEDPYLLVLVSVDEPQGADQYGGSVAAPFVATILKQSRQIVSRDELPPLVKLASEPEILD